MSSTTRPRIAFISPCGYGNLGDVAIQDTFIAGVRERLGASTEIVGITQNPPDTEERHHVRAVPMDRLAFRLRSAAPRTKLEGATSGERTKRGLVRAAVELAKDVVKETVHWGIAIREMRRNDVLVVSGGGQLDDHWGGSWRVPYALWKWSLTARILRKDVVVLSVGAGTTDARLTRSFLRATLRRARYASFRDERTRDRVRTLRLSSSSRLVPDLAFGHDGRRAARVNGTPDRRPVIAISPIAFLDPVAWPAKDVGRYRSNLDRTAKLAELLAERGFQVVVCTSDTPDVKSAEELGAAVAEASHGKVSIELAQTRTPAELLEAFARADIAIASRLHGLILANLAGTPTVALSYDWKVDEHMRSMDLERYTFPIDTFDPATVAAAIDEMLARRDELAASVAERCELFADAVQAQFAEVFTPEAPVSADRA